MRARRIFLLLAVLLIAIGAAYSSSFDGAFILDDSGRIVENVRIRDISSVAKVLSVRYIVDLTLAVDYMMGGLNPAYYHFTNLIIHLLCSIVLFMLIRVLVLSSGRSLRDAEWGAFFVVLLWGVHPLTTSAVTYICQRYESLMSLFYLASMLCCAEGVRRGGITGRLLLGVSVVACLLGMFCKQVMVTAPFMILLMDGVFLSGNWRKALKQKPLYYVSLGLCMAVLVGLMLFFSSDHAVMFSTFSAKYGRWLYFVNQGRVILNYLKLSFWPHPLSIDYAWLPMTSGIGLWLSFAAVGAMFSAALWGLIRYPKKAFAAFAVFVLLSPSSSLIPLPDLAFEHRMYLPLAGLIAFIVILSGSRLGEGWPRKAAGILAMLLALVLGVVTYHRGMDYREPAGIWEELGKRIPHNMRAIGSLANEQLKRQDYVDAEKTARKMLHVLGEMALDDSVLYDIPSSSPSMYEPMVRGILGQALMGQQRYVDALAEFHALVSVYPNDVSSLQNRGLALIALGRKAEGERDIDEVLRLSKGSLEASMVKAELLIESGLHEQAREMLERVLARRPRFVPARVEAAWLLSVSPQNDVRNGEKALSLLKGMENEKGVPNVRIYDVTAAAFAEKGDYHMAVKFQSMAAADARKYYRAGDERTSQIEARLKLYLDGKPFRIALESEAIDSHD